MKKRTTGVAFIFFAVLLFISRYITTAIWCSGTSSKTGGYHSIVFNDLVESIGKPLLTCSIVSLIVGIVYLIWAEKVKE